MRTRFLAIALTLSLAPTFLASAPSFAQNTETDALMREMRGESPAPTRDAAAWQSAYAQVLASLLPDMSSDDLGKRGAAQNAWEKIVLRATRPGAEPERAGVVAAMLPKIGADTPLDSRLWLLKMLEWSARGEAVASLSPLLLDSDAQVAERARRALANNSAPQAGAALLQALGKATTPDQKAALINALGFRREASAIPAIKAALSSPDELVASQAVRALAEMDKPEAAAALLAFKPAAPLAPVVSVELIDAASRVRVADPKVAATIFETVNRSGPATLKPAALRGLVLVRGTNALPLVVEALKNPAMSARAARLTLLMPGANASKALATALPTLPASAQVLVLPALAERVPANRDASLTTAVSSLMNSATATPDVKGAAARALGELGNAADITPLLKLAAVDSPARDGARAALGRLGVARRDGTIIEAKLADVAIGEVKVDDATRVEAVRALSARRADAAMPVFVKLLDDSSGDVKAEAARALGENGGAAQVPVLAAWMGRSGDTATGEKALQSIFGRVDKAQIAPAPFLQVLDAPGIKPNVRASAFKLLGQLGATAGFERVRTASTDANADVSDAAIRALADWPNPEAVPALMQIARNAPKPVYQVLALRGVARLAPNAGDDASKVAILREGLALAKRGEEKQLMLAALANIRTAQSLEVAQSALGDEGLRDEAASTIFKIAKEMRGQDLQNAKPTLQKAFDATQNADLKRDLRGQLDRN
jgi:HEAT repeat protein